MSHVREARLAAGLSQGALASAAGLSRQAVGAIEAGHNRPSVDAALALAGALGRRVEDLFAPPTTASEALFGPRAAEREGVLACRVGARIVHAPAGRALAFQGWPAPNAVIRDGRPVALPGADLDGLLVVGCDPALGLAAAMLPQTGPRHVVALSGSTGAALQALRAGRVHGALVHNQADRLPTPPRGTLRLHLSRWRVGVASRGPHARSIEELCDRDGAVVQREDGASSQKAFVAAATAAGRTPPEGPRACGHLEVAQRVADGAPAGVTMEPAALSHGLAFDALEEHVCELWLHAQWREHPATDALANMLRSRAFTQRLQLVGGYDTNDSGSQRSQST